MGRLEEKLAQVAGVGDRVTSHLEARADAILAREPKLIARGDALFDAKAAILDEASSALDGIENSLKLLSNAPLPASGSSANGAVSNSVPVAAPPVVGQQAATFQGAGDGASGTTH